MKAKRHSWIYVISAISIVLAVFQPLVAIAQTEEPEPPPTGDLVIYLVGSDGATLDGCFSVTDANGVSQATCSSGGAATVSGLAAGTASVSQTDGPAGYEFAPAGSATVPDGGVGEVTLTATYIPPPTPTPVPPTPTPPPPTATVPPPTATVPPPTATDAPATEDPTEDPGTPTEESTEQATETPTEIPEDDLIFQPFAAGDITLDCQHTTGQTTTTFTVSAEDIPGDVQPFTITIVPYDLQGNQLPPQEFTIPPTEQPIVFEDVEWRRIDVTVQFSDGSSSTAAAGCNNDPLQTDITTSPQTTEGEAIPDGGSLEPGTAMIDTATLDGQSVDASGTVTYYLYDSADCSGDPVFTSGPLDVVNGEVPSSSPPYTPTGSGQYEWVVVYSGDVEQGDPTQNSNFNSPAESGCGEETVVVGQVETDLTTGMQTADGDTIPQQGTIPQGTDVIDTATLSGATDTAGGTVTYTLYEGECPGTPVDGASFTVDVTDGVVPPSDVVSDLPAGTYNWVVSYSGDDQNLPSESGCGEETFTVGQAQPTVTTTMFDAEDNEIADGAVVPVGTSMYDTATIDGFAEPLTGTVTFALYDSADCTGTPVAGPFESTIGEDGTIPPSPAVELNSTGTYNWVVTYSGNEANESASSDCGSETVNVEPASPTITTEIFNAADDSVIDPGSVVDADSTVYDTATLDGATDDATGTVTFSLYNNFTCTGEPYFTVTVPLNDDGTIPPTPDVGPLPGGTWNWTASYSGDENNNPASTACGDEEFFIGQGEGGITTMVEDESGTDYPDGSQVEVDTVLRDTAVLDGVTPDAGGSVTFYLYEGADCSGDLVFTSDPVPVVDGELQGPSGTFTFVDQGTYQWVAVYSGDENNAGVSSPCGAETIVVVGKPSSVTTAMFTEDDTAIANNDRVLSGTAVYDTAIVTPEEATGTLTYELYNNANCSGTPIEVFSDVPVGDPSPLVSEPTPGVYNWVVTYSGDAEYAESVSSCSSETFYIALQPSITTLMVDENGDEIPNNSTIQAGDFIGDTAELIDATDDASGTVTYYFYDSADCTGTPVFAPQVTVANGEVPPSGVFQPPFTGEWSIQAEYSGDNTNFPAVSECGTENFVVDPESDATIWTTMRADGEVIPHQSEIRFLPATVTDSVTILGIPDGTTGDVTFELYKSDDCSGAPVFTDSYEDVVASAGSGWSLTSQPFSLAVEDWGTYNWVVSASGDINGDGEPESFVSECGEETFTGVSENPRTVNINCTYNSQTQLTTFRVLVAKPTTADPDIDPNLIVVATPTDNFLTPLDPITYHAYDSSNPDSGVIFVQQPWRQLTVQVTWPDGQTGAAFANCNTNTLTPDLTTAMFAVETTPIENGETVEIGTQVYDTATLTDGTTRWSGELTYTLYLSEDCASGTEVGSPQVFTLDPEATTLPPSDPVTVTQPGTYNWVVSYSGDQNNEPATSGCGEEFFQIVPLDVTVLTQVILDETGAAVPDDGSVAIDSSIHDTTVLDGALDTVSGEVTYTLYSTDDCSGDPAFTETVTISNGVVPPSSSVTVDNVGTWNWVVSYSGDDFHNPATSACGDETVLVEQATPAITTDLSVDEASAGDEVYDTATMTGASGNAGGEVTYFVYSTDDCSGDPLYTLGPVTVENGVVPDSPPQVFDTPGHYEWQAVYSGDANNVGATSVCGTEPLDIVAPDVVVDKSVGVTPIVAGENASFTITVSNIGQGNAYDVVVTDDLPDGVDWTIDPAVDGCAIADGTLDCTFATLAPGESVDITVTGTTDAEDCGFMINVASATASNEPDDATGNNQDASLLRVDCPNIRVLKVADPGEVTATDPVSFTIEVRNIGLGRADNVQLVDELPAELAPWTIDPAVEGCEIADDDITLTCDIGSLERGETFSVTVVGTSGTDDCGVIANEASATADNESDSATGNNTDDAEVQILCAEMLVTKSASSGVVSAGEDVSYTVTATNNGAGIAYNSVVTDTLPAGLVWSETPDNPNCEIATGDPQVLTCDFGDMAPGATNAVTVTATTDAAACGVLANSAEVESSSDDANNDISNTESRVVEIEVLCPDILVEKTTSTGVVSAGDDVSFTIAVTNAGEGIATDVTVEDELPAGIEWTIDPAVEGCAIADGTLTCAFDAIGPLETIEITVTGTTDAADCGVLTNTANGTAGNEPDDATGNNSGTAEITVDCPDIVVEKARNGVPVLSAGDDVSFTVTVSNTGSGDAHDVVVTDDLPDGIEWAIDPAVDGCAITDGTLECTFATLPAGASVDITVTGTTDAADCGLLPNTASATASNEADDATDNNSDSAIVLVQCPDILVEKTTSTPDVSAGDDVSFTITVSNDGSGDAYDVVVTDALPAGVDWTIAPEVEGCAITDGTLECSFDTLEPGESVAVTVTGTTDADDCGTLENLASAESSNEADDATENNSDSADITVNCPDILVEKSTTTPIVNSGDEVDFTITVSNPGEGTAYDVIMTDDLPAGIFWTETPDNPDCSISGDGLTLTCEIGTMEPGAAFSVTVSGTTDAADCGILPNTANAAASNEADDDQFPNEAEASITVNCPDIVVEKTAGTPVVTAGDDVSFTVTVSNTGTGDANDVVLTDELPAGIEWTIAPSVEGCEIAGNVLTCDFGTLASGASIAVTLAGTTDAADCGVLTNTADGTASNESDDDQANNSATAEITVDCPDVVVSKTAGSQTVVAGEDAIFTITVSNTGEGEARNVVLTDELPAGIDWVIDPAVEGCAITDGTLDCTFATLAAGESVDITLVGATDATDCGLVTNLASATADNEASGDTANNSDRASQLVLCSNLRVIKTAETDVVTATDPVSFTIEVQNIGLGRADNVQLVDELPEAFSPWTIDPAVQGCAIGGDGFTLTCDIGSLERGESFAVTVVGTSGTEDCGIIENVAEASASNEPDSATGNNTDEAEIQVLCSEMVVTKSASSGVVSAGDDVSYTITATNLGEGIAYNVVVTDELPAGLEWSETPDNPNCEIADGVTLNCDFGDLATGESVSVTVTATTDAADCGVLANRASVESSSDDAGNDPLNNQSRLVEIEVLCPDVVVGKSAGTPVVSAGDDVSYTVTVSNIGEGVAYDVEVTDELPAGIEWTIDPAVDGCAIADGTLDCSFATLPAGESIDITVTGTTDAADCGIVANTASGTASNEDDSDSGNNSDTAEITIDCPDVVVEKTAGSQTVVAGEDVSFTITVSNTGTGNAYNVTVTDDLPDGIEWAIDPAVDGCAIADGSLDCSFATLAAGESVDITITGTTDAEDCGLVTNLAEASADNEAGDATDNNSDRANLLVLCANLRVLKVADPGEVTATDPVSFTIEVRNIGLGRADNVQLVDELPAELVPWTIDPAVEGCEIAGDGITLTCDIGSLERGETFSVTVVGTSGTEDCGVIANEASATADNEANEDTDNNTDEAEVQILCAEMRVTKSASSGVVSAGDDVSYTITVDNQGDGPAYNTVVTDELPAGVEWTIDPAVEGCAIDGADPQVLTCDLGTLPSGESVQITVVGTTDAADCGVLANRAEVASSSDDANNDISNTESRLVEIEVLCPDILVEKTAGTDVLSAGDDVSFTIAVTNTGEGIATDVTVEDQLPAGIVWTIDPPVDGCAIAGAMLQCSFETVGPLETIEITVTGTTDAADCGVLTNTASGTAGNEAEDATGNNSGTAEITVDCPNIIVEKTAGTPVVSAGDDVSFTVTVTNAGEGDAADVILSDELPAGVEWAIDPAVEGCGVVGNVLTCEFDTLASGQSISVTLTGTTDAADCGVLANTAFAAASNEPQDETDDNSDTAEITIDCPDVVVEKTAGSLTVVAGEEASFTITVSNIGEGTAHNVVVTDELPAGIDWEIEPAVDNCGIAGGSLSCEFETLAPGESIDIMVVGATSAENCGLITNLASASADNEPVDANANNSDRATLRVNCANVRVIKTTDTPEVTAGDPVSFTIEVQNVGLGRADNVQLVDTLPADLAPWTIDPAVEGCEIAGDGITLTCDIGSLERGESFDVTVTATTDAEDCGVIENVATATADNEPDSATGNNTDASEVQVLCAEMVVTKSASSGVVSAGDDVSYTITAINLDEGTAYDVVVTDELPAGLEWTESPDNPDCTIADGDPQVLTCTFGDMAPGDTNSVTVTATTDADDCGVLANRALVESSSDDAGDDIRNNQSRLVEIEVDCADIVVEKTTSTPTVSAGDDVNFTITVSNAGPGDAHDVLVTDDLPDGIEWVIDPAVEGCAITDGTLECTFDTLAAGQAIDITITGTTAAVDCGVLTNTATGQSGNEPSGDDDDDNNSSTAEITVDCPDIVVEKVSSGTDLTVGDQVSFTIAVTNTGEGNAYDVVVTDQLPEGFNWDVTGDYAEDCTSEGGQLVCTIPVLGPGETAEIIVSAPTTTSNCGVVENTASGTAGNEPDDATDNNEASADVTIICPEPSPSPTPSPTPTEPDDDSTPTPTPDDGTKTPTPADPSTPISVLPETGTGDSGGGLGITVWAQIAAAIVALVAAIAMGQGSFRRGTTRDDT